MFRRAELDGASRHSPAASARSAALNSRGEPSMTIDWPAAYRKVEKRIADNERACREQRRNISSPAPSRAASAASSRSTPTRSPRRRSGSANRDLLLSEFIRNDDPVRWRDSIFEPYRAEVERQLALNAQALQWRR